MTKTLVTFLLDRTGSMAAVKDDTIGAFNAYLEELKKGQSIDFTFLQFDSMSIDKVCVREPIANVEPLTPATYQPRAWTPLIDAVYKTITATDAALKEMPSDTKVVICIQTDGEENASQEHTWLELNALITARTDLGWQFNFMGVGLDAYNQGAQMGIAASYTMAYDPLTRATCDAAFMSNARNTVAYAAGLVSNTSYSHDQKLAAGDAFDNDPGSGSGGYVKPGTLHGGSQFPAPSVKKTTVKSATKKTIVEDFKL